MDAYDRCTNLGKKIFPILLPSMVEAKAFQTTHIVQTWEMFQHVQLFDSYKLFLPALLIFQCLKVMRSKQQPFQKYLCLLTHLFRIKLWI